MQTEPVDNPARCAALDPDRSFVVQAPAGSGKTGLLIRRFLILMTRVRMPEEILAITFTRKATAEMKDRVLSALQEAARDGDGSAPADELVNLGGAALARDREMGWNLLQHPGRLRIMTIDAFCADLVRNMPWSSRFGAVPSLVESDQARGMYRDAAIRVLSRVDGEDACSAQVSMLLDLCNSDIGTARDLVMRMLEKRDLWLRGIDLDRREQFESMWDELVDRYLENLAGLIPESIRDDLAVLSRHAAENLAAADPGHPLCTCLKLEALPPAEAGHLDAWRAISSLLLTKQGSLRRSADKRIGFPAETDSQRARKQQMQNLLAALAPEDLLIQSLSMVPILPDPRFSDRQWETMDALLHIMRLAVAELKLLFSHANSADYVEITQRAELALGPDDMPSDLALAMDYRLGHLLMDEVQDTSRAQVDLVTRLTRGWTPGDGRTLFFVGDPMQSIYRFREAEVGNFLDIKARGIGMIRPEPLKLQQNFRSGGSLVDWFNRTFERVFPDEDLSLGAIGYSPSTAFLGQTGDNAVTILGTLDAGPEQEAAEIVNIVGSTLAQAPESTIGILGRSRSHLFPIAERLRSASIPFQAVDLDPLAERPAILDLMALTRALLQPMDRIAWLSVLRAPWCGLELADLTRLGGDDRRSAPIPSLARDPGVLGTLSEDGRQRLAGFMDRIDTALAAGQNRSVRQIVQHAWLRIGGPQCIGEQDADDCEQYLQLLDSLESEHRSLAPATLEAAVDALWSRTDSDAQVELMTIHKAKGLEFDIVILPGLERTGRHDPKELIQWARKDELLLVAPLANTREGDPFNPYLARLERDRQANENLRLLYVACTRARQKLVLCGNLKSPSSGAPAPRSGSLLRQLWPAIEADFLESMRHDGQDPDTPQAPEKTYCRLPAGWVVPGMPEGIRSLHEKPAGEGLPVEPIEFSWVMDTLRITGIAIHRLVELIEPSGWEKWKRRKPEELMRGVLHILIENGLTGRQLSQARKNLRTAVRNLQTDPRADWIFSPRHSRIRAEWALSGTIEGQPLNIVIDRCFVDDNGVRWIIDFKSSRHENDDLEAFLDQEQSRYASQLERYARIANMMQAMETRVALYFPLLKEWREWTP